MAFDGIVTQAITHELKNDLIGGKIDKIHQPDKNTILLGIYSNSIHYALNICIDAHNCRINLTTNSKENPLVAPNFCMLLRKHLIGGKISTIEMYGLERLVKINIETINEFNEIEIKSLIIELMGKHSNIILINDKNIIIDSLRHIWATDTIYRDILPSRTYSFPTSEKLDYTKISDIYSIFQDNLNLSVEEFSKLFANTFNGFSLSFIKSALEKCNITTINKENLLKLQKYINNILTFPNNLYFTEVYKNNKLSDFTLSLGNNVTVEKFYLNKFIDNFYFSRETEETFNNCKNNALKLTNDSQKKLLNRLNSINTKLKDCEERDKYRLYGELITSNLYKLTNTHTDYIKLENYYDNNNLIKIPLDKKYSPNINAKHYFKKYNKLKNALQIVSVQKAETENELNYIDSIIFEIELASSTKEIQEILDEISENLIKKKVSQKKKNTKNSKKKKQEKQYSPLHFNIDNFDVYVGKNNKENDWLTFTFANKNDIWLHTKDIQGSHVILKNSGQNVSDDTLVKCAKLAVEHSKAKFSSNVPVDYCKVQYVKKPNGAKPGMVIFTNNKTISVTSCQ
jgi:predicted ribosome quality control (RQC) complex YloA/Tae2 family protein